jgi:hypothetical protein
LWLLCTFSANAFELDGAWTTDAANCSKIFKIINGRVSMTRNSDVYGRRLHSREKSDQRAGKNVQNKQPQGGRRRSALIVFCSTEIAVLGTQQVDAKIDGDDRLTRIFPVVSGHGDYNLLSVQALTRLCVFPSLARNSTMI